MSLDRDQGHDLDREQERTSEQHTEPPDHVESQLFEQAFNNLHGVEELGRYPSESAEPTTAAPLIDPEVEGRHVDENRPSSLTAEMSVPSVPARKKRNGGKGTGQTLVKRNADVRDEASPASGLGDIREITREVSPVIAKSPENATPSSKYTNKEQLAMLRTFYLENPTPTKVQIIELANTTGRPWSKVKEYFRQRRNKLRGVDEAGLEGMGEPDRATSWYTL
jgi:hypothetical protein